MGEAKEYIFGGRLWFQRPLVLGQIQQLARILQGLKIPRNASAATLQLLLGDQLPQALAIALTPENVNLRDKDIDALSGEIAFSISPEQTLQVIDDFFTCNPIALLFRRLEGMIDAINLRTPEMTTGSPASLSSLQGETSPGGTLSCGNTHGGT